ncbi:MAG: DNA cytosine methyltransferase [Pseudomonadota bacterium]
MMSERPSFLEFFAGGGMARIGLAELFECTFANDIDPGKCTAYRANFGSEHLFEGDIAALRAGDLPGADLAWASFPCQDLSVAGARGGLDARRSGTFWSFWRLMQAMATDGRPVSTIVLENVSGLLSSAGGADMSAIVCALADAGYTVGALLLDAADHTPQSRLRLFIIATLHAPSNTLAAPDTPPLGTPTALLAAHAQLPRRAQDAWTWWTPPRSVSNRPSLSDCVDRAVPDDAWRSRARLERLLGQMSPVHRAKVSAAERDGSFHVGAVYRRMRKDRQAAEVRYDGLAGCLRTLKGGSSRQLLLITDQGETRLRPLLPIEGARLMGLPEAYILPDGATAAFNILGDGVCVPVVRALGEQILRPLLQDAERSELPIGTARAIFAATGC